MKVQTDIELKTNAFSLASVLSLAPLRPSPHPLTSLNSMLGSAAAAPSGLIRWKQRRSRASRGLTSTAGEEDEDTAAAVAAEEAAGGWAREEAEEAGCCCCCW